MKIIQSVFIDAAHQLKDTPDLMTKKCCNLHGHTYKITSEFDSLQNASGLSVDFSVIKDLINILDHQYINDIFGQWDNWKSEGTTAENIAKFIHSRIMMNLGVQISNLKVSVVEGYKGPDSPIVTYDPN